MKREFSLEMFASHESSWRHLMAPLVGKPQLDYLEVGTYEGRSLCWMLDNVLTDPSSKAVAVDTWDVQPDWEEHTKEDWAGVWQRFNANVAGDRRVRIVAMDSAAALAGLVCERARFDVAYVDGSHRALACLIDMCMAWVMLKPGGLLIVDDVEQWVKPAHWPAGDCPAAAVRMFSEASNQQVVIGNGQAIFQKGA